jgi:D-serine dehydratase
MAVISLDSELQRELSARCPLLWLNPAWRPLESAGGRCALNMSNVRLAELRWLRHSALLARLFPQLQSSQGIIESPLIDANALQKAMGSACKDTGRWLIKGDHALPIVGSVKARGGIYEVLVHAESLARRHGILDEHEGGEGMTSPAARDVFRRHRVSVGSTGNLGLSIGIMSAALGFRATVHMSADAKEWKKRRLRMRGVEVIEHNGDFGAAVAAGRQEASQAGDCYFVDDENSEHLFLGYSVAALRLRAQLVERGIEVDQQHPLFVYIPCGVGGAPGGITFGLRHLFGDNVHCFTAEPVASPSMLMRLASRVDHPVSVMDIDLDNQTEADGLAVAQASEFVVPLLRPLLSGGFTVTDAQLFEDLYRLEKCASIRIEPSAAAGFRGPNWITESDAGRRYISDHCITEYLGNATHILWTTGGALIPDDEYRAYYRRGLQVVSDCASSGD